MELIIAFLITGISAAYLITAIYGRLKKPSCSCGCGQCPLDKQHTCDKK